MDQSRAPLSLRFGPFAFDEANAQLRADGRVIALAPKTFSVLAELLRSAGQLVTKDAMLDAVWGHRHVSESVLKNTISELRAALGDDAKSPRWIETASRRGYRFVGAIEGATGMVLHAATFAPAVPPSAAAPGLIARASSLAQLQAAWELAAGGRRQHCFVAGEAGIGKTTLIEAFVTEARDVMVAHGQCIEQVGEGEPYLPVLDALSSLARADDSLAALLRRVAPTWLLQLPWLIEREEQERLQASLAHSTQDRMLREFSELVEQLTATRPLLLVTEDLHWCDEATVRLIDHVARRRPAARLMWLGSYRTSELVARDHPLNGLRHELRARRLCEELLLEPFSEAELRLYLALHRPEFVAGEAQVRQLHRHTDGLPLFVANALDELAAPESATGSDEDWAVPDSLAGIIERQRSRLAPDVAALLEAAAVCGVEFDCSVVADMLGRPAAGVAAQCDELARQQAWLAPASLDTLADGTFDAHFVFLHALYRQALYQQTSPSARASLHRRAAVAIEKLRTVHRPEPSAAVLALHCERGLDFLGAMRAYAAAGERALGRFAPREALLLTARGLALLERCPEGELRLDAELALQQIRGTSLGQSTGVSTLEARTAYLRCAELCELLPPTRSRAWAVIGLGWMFNAAGEYAQAASMALRLRMAADSFDDDLLRVAAAVSQAVPLLQQGRLAAAAVLVDEAQAAVQALGYPRVPPTVMHDPSALTFSIGAVVHAFRGDGELARTWARMAIARAELLGQPLAFAFAARCANLVDVRFHRADDMLARAQRTRDIANENRMAQPLGLSLAMLGWAHAQTGAGLQGLREAEEGCAAHVASGLIFEATCVLRLAADAALLAGNLSAARGHIDAGLTEAVRTGEVVHLPDLWLASAALAAREGDLAGARKAAETAADVAREHGGLTAELLARLAICELPGTTQIDREALREVRDRWRDPTAWPALARVDALLASLP